MRKKRKNSKKRHQSTDTLRYIDNQLTILFNDKDFLKLIEQEKKKFKEASGKDLDSRAHWLVGFNNSIKAFLQKRDLPVSLLEPVYSLIRYNRLDPPLHTSIILRVGAQDVVANRDVVFIKNKEGRLASEENSISIVLTTKTSAEQIIQFVRDYKKLIEELQTEINLPAYKRPTWRREIQLALKIIKMRDENKMSFFDISSELTKEDSGLTVEKHDSLSNEETVKSIYYNYKKRLSL